MPRENAIALVDCNNFFASCERVVNPALQDRPVAILSNNDGCIISRSDEVKAMGVPMAAPVFQYREVLEKNNTAIISCNHAMYYEFSHRVMEILSENIGAKKLELYSIDEAFIDVGTPDELEMFGRHIKDLIFEKTKIPVSVGMAKTKTLAKMANHLAKTSKKTGGVLDLYDSPFIDIALKRTAVENIWGIGARSAVHLKEHGIHTAFDLKNSHAETVRGYLNVFSSRTVMELNGVKCLSMEVTDRDNKSIAHTRTFGKAMTNYEDLREAILFFTTRALEKMRWNGLAARSVSVFLQTDRFRPEPYFHSPVESYRSVYHSDATSEIYGWVEECLQKTYRPGMLYRRAGMKLSELKPVDKVGGRLFDTVHFEKRHRLSKLVDEVNFRYGRDILRYAVLKDRGDWQGKSEHRGNDSYHAVGRDTLGRGKTFSKSLRFL